MNTSAKIDRMHYLVHLLNTYRDAYYNDAHPIVTDAQYDKLFDELAILESELGITIANSPTQSVGFEVKSKLDKVTHEYPPLLSLDKTKEVDKIIEFLHGKTSLVMAKLDGLTCRLTYEDGKLIQAASRGNGVEGEDITHNIKYVKNVPLTIPIMGHVMVDGEIIVCRHDFQRLKTKFLDEEGKEYKNPRNYAAGSARLQDSEKAAARGLQFLAWKAVKGWDEFKYFSTQLNRLDASGFTTVPFSVITCSDSACLIEQEINRIKDICQAMEYPIDGCVFGFEEIEYLNTFGYTSHHWQAQKAFKFEDDKYDTIIRDIEWTIGKTGAITPTAIFDKVEIDGTEVGRASLHNLTIMGNLGITKNCSAKVYKANMIIPQIYSVNQDGFEPFDIPQECPVCGSKVVICQENDSAVLRCLDPHCIGTILGKMKTFVSKNGMDIEGLNEGKLLFLLEKGFIEDYISIYELPSREGELLQLPGWGETSVYNLIDAIEKSRKTTLDHFIVALNIPNIGPASAKMIALHCNYNYDTFVCRLESGYNWSVLEGFSNKTTQLINTWYSFNSHIVRQFRQYLVFESKVASTSNPSSKIAGKTFCITGSFNKSRSVLQTRLEELGGIAQSGVSKKTDILFVGENAGSKLEKGKKLGIQVIEGDEINLWLEN